MHPQPRILVLVAALAAASVAVAGAHAQSTAAAEPSVVVEPGDTLSQIALDHGLTVDALAGLNRLDDPNRIYVGQKLALKASRPTVAPRAPAAAPATTLHEILAGEYLIAIAERYGTTVTAIAAANGLANPSFIRAGDRLRIPGRVGAARPPAPAPKAAPTATRMTVHVVLSGENLTGIAARYGTTIAAIVGANAIADASYVQAGDRLQIPGARAAQTTTAAPRSMPGVSAAQRNVRAVIVAEARRFGVPAALALAVAWQESGWRQGVVSQAGAVGVMQLLPDTGDWVGEAMLHERVDIGNLRSNVHAGVRLLAHYLERYGGDRNRTLAAYYQGQHAVDTRGIYPMSRPYIGSILALEALLAGS
ncbi:MAG: LysM peptidoglycan-binding domain-containing protein [Chloroflexota bacterium]